MRELDELIGALLILTRANEQADHWRDQPRTGGQFASHGGGSSKKHKEGKKPKTAKQEEVGIFAKSEGADEEGGYYRQMPDGGIEWVAGGVEPAKTEPGQKTSDATLKANDGRDRSATVTDHNGVSIVAPDDLDTSAQRLTVDDVKTFIDQVPNEHRDVFTEVRILDEPFQEKGEPLNDRISATYYPETGVIEIHKNSQFPESELRTRLSQTVRHEGAHALTDKLPKSFVAEWKKSALKDGGYISDYAKTNTHEDIAETIARHWSPDKTDRRTVERFFPERYALLLKYGIKPGG